MKKLITITAISCALALPALAGPGKDGDGKGGRPGGPDGQGKGGKRPNPEQIMEHLDADKSGGISLEEFKNGPMAKRAKDPSMVEERFTRMDADGDGEVTKEELVEAHKKMAARRGQGGKPGQRPGGGKKQRPDADS